MKYFLLSFFVLIFSSTFSQTTADDQIVTSPEITVREYVVFLNAAASLSNVHALYTPTMNVQIYQSKSSDAYHYFVANGATANQCLVNYNIMQEYRYCNWIEHGSPKKQTAAEASTETGSYDLIGSEVIVNPEAKHHLFNESGFFFAITAKIDSDSSQKKSGSPLAMFWRSERSQEAKKNDPKSQHDPQAALRRQADEVNPSVLVLRANPLFDGPTERRTPADPTSQPKNSTSRLSSTQVLATARTDAAKAEEELIARSEEEESYLAHVTYFEQLWSQQGIRGATPLSLGVEEEKN